MTKNEILTLKIEGYTSSGDGVARADGRVVFVRRAIFGETVNARVLKVGASVVYARLEDVLEPSPERIEPACPNFGKCGGCDFLHMSYPEELRAKHRRVSDALERIGKAAASLPDVVPSPVVNGYRNKAVFEVGKAPDGRAVTGFYRERSHDVIPAETCVIQSEASLRAAAAVRSWMDSARVPDTLVRHIFFREGRGAQIAIITRRAELPHREKLISVLRERVPEAVGILQIINNSPGNAVLNGSLRVLYGSEYLEDTLGGFTFRLSPRAFYQVNRAQAEALYSFALSLAAPTKSDAALDLYCGAGTITLALARLSGRAFGAEIIPDAVSNARENAALNGVTNAEFLLADSGEAARQLAQNGVSPSVVVVDPPRKGLHPDVISSVARIAPRRVVYISCDPATLARDIRLFADCGYSTAATRAFDMFPRCAHVECVTLLENMNM
ncbi:MAG: 23S rRNA (uracil(1939)-C(5))-methyltransferase RlmD [Oscillospiraceae bacterium]|jgi:23S rRNA (uracil1939-C5)-methyltransferase|nr:23S rRNA (uracil(1939)-C(5))-methyltransferase RlmD [Oscillospiraceae bacterium]